MEVIIPKGNLAEIIADDSGATVPSDTISLANLPDASYRAQPGTTIRDHGAEAERAQIESDRTLMVLNPELAKALNKKTRALGTVQFYAQQVRTHEAEVSRLSNLVSCGSVSHEDFANGEPLPARSVRLAAALEQLREAREELVCAIEEFEAAKARVVELTQVSYER